MSTFTLAGAGTHAISSGTTALHITITTLPGGLGAGRANPTNHFDVGLLRFGDGTGYSAPVAITGGPQWIGVPIGTTIVGYAILNSAAVSVEEIIGGTSPDPVINVTSPVGLMPLIISASSRQSIAAELAANAVATGASAGWITANLACLTPATITDSYTSAFAWVLNGGIAAGHWDVGVYDSSLNLLGHTGSQAQAGISGFQAAALALTLTPGRYWLAMSADSTSLTTATFSFGGVNRIRLVGIRAASGAFPLASNPTLIAPTFGVLPVFGLSTYSP